jgi:hypothetical protein
LISAPLSDSRQGFIKESLPVIEISVSEWG